MNRLNQQYYDAILSGDSNLAGELKSQLDEQTKLAQKATKSFTININTVLNNDDSPAIVLYTFLNERYGDDWWDWEIETLERMLWIDFGAVMSDNNADKVQAVKLLINNQRPFLDWFYFNQVSVALSGSIADFNTIKSPSSGMAISAVKTMMEIRPEEPFSRDVKKYISLLLINDGIYIPPPSISSIIKDEFEQLVSSESKGMWKDILNRCKDIIENKDYGKDDETVSIQARRVVLCEEAANTYGG
ncbi:MAG TPA: hypothetical protein VMV86_06110 [Methanosarcinales archaeon]|nr:hypothetical protein [Methanosarcinales archaeon]